MASIRIDRLSLRVPGLSSSDAGELARLIGVHLADATFARSGSEVQAMNVQVADTGHRNVHRMASQIAAEVQRQLA